MICKLSPLLASLVLLIACFFHRVWDKRVNCFLHLQEFNPKLTSSHLCHSAQVWEAQPHPPAWSSSTLHRQIQDYWGRQRQRSTCTLSEGFEKAPAHTYVPFCGVAVTLTKKSSLLVRTAIQPGSAALTSTKQRKSSRTARFTWAAALQSWALRQSKHAWETTAFGALDVSFWINHLSVHCSQLPVRTRLFTASKPFPF